MRCSREIQLFGQSHDRMQMTNINLGEHWVNQVGFMNTPGSRGYPTSI